MSEITAVHADARLGARFCHDCRTPLTVIAESAAIVRDELSGHTIPDAEEFLGLITSRVSELEGLVDDFQFLNRQLIKGRHAERPSTTLDDALADIRNLAPSIRVRVDAETTDRDIGCDRALLKRAISGIITDFTRRRPGDALFLDIAPEEVAWRFTISTSDPVPLGDWAEIGSDTQEHEGFRMQVAAALLAWSGGQIERLEHRDGSAVAARVPCAGPTLATA